MLLQLKQISLTDSTTTRRTTATTRRTTTSTTAQTVASKPTVAAGKIHYIPVWCALIR